MKHKFSDVIADHIEMLENLEAIKGAGYALTVGDMLSAAHVALALNSYDVPSVIESEVRKFVFHLIYELAQHRGVDPETGLKEAMHDAERLMLSFQRHSRAAI